MNLLFVGLILVSGATGLTAQAVLLRELLINFYGNELTLGVILANWLAAVALGAIVSGAISRHFKEYPAPLVCLQILFTLSFPFAIFCARTFKGLLGFHFGESIGLSAMFWISFLVVLPVGFCHGGLFAPLCKAYSQIARKQVSIGRVYSIQTFGAMLGGLALTYLFFPFLNSFQAAFLAGVLNLGVSLFFIRDLRRPLRSALIVVSACWVLCGVFGGVYHLQNNSIHRQWKGYDVVDYRNSIYGNVAVTRQERQYTFFYNGLPVVIAPFPDVSFVQDFGNLPLLFHPYPKKILMLTGGAGGVLNEVLGYPSVSLVDYAELDPLIIEMVRKYPTTLTRRELTDQRVKVSYIDSRLFLKERTAGYDVILVGTSRPADLAANRLFTEEFFRLSRERLAPGGILSFCLPGSLTALSTELRDFNYSILAALRSVYSYVRVIPGDYNMFLASDSPEINEIGAETLIERRNIRNIRSELLLPRYIKYRLDSQWVDWFDGLMKKTAARPNRDFTPSALFQMLLIWTHQFSRTLARVLALVARLDLAAFAFLVLFLTAAFFFIFRKKPEWRTEAISWAVATTGFYGMLINLALIFGFQVLRGYLYHMIGLLIAVFMAGVALGGAVMIRAISRVTNGLSLLARLELLIAGFSVFTGWLITVFFPRHGSGTGIFVSLLFAAGFILGLEFTLAGKIYLSRKGMIGEGSGILYAADLLGGWLAGILGGTVLLPVIGLFQSCILIAFFKLSSLVLLPREKAPV